MKIKPFINRLKKTSYSGGVLSVTIGTLIGQGFLILATPILTRMYTPEDMGLYSVFVALVGMFSIIVGLHYELAIPLPKSNAQSRLILRLTVLIIPIFSIFVGLLIFLYRQPILSNLGASQLADYIWIVPISLALTGFVTAYNYWNIRIKRFGVIGVVKASQGVAQTIPQVILGALKLGPLGLIAGSVIGLLVNLLIVLRRSPRLLSGMTSAHEAKKMFCLARKYKNFPLFTTLSSFINSLASHAPIFFLAMIYSVEITGFFALSLRVLQLPARFFGQSVSQVFFSAAASAHHVGQLDSVTTKLMGRIVSFGMPTFFILAFISPDLFSVLFGSAWREAGVYSTILAPWIFFIFLTTALNVLISVLQKQKWEMRFQFLYAFLLCLSLSTGFYFDNPMYVIGLLSLAGSSMLFFKTYFLLKFSSVKFSVILQGVISELPILVSSLAIVYFIDTVFKAGAMATTISGLLVLVIIHIINYQFRDVYGLK